MELHFNREPAFLQNVDLTKNDFIQEDDQQIFRYFSELLDFDTLYDPLDRPFTPRTNTKVTEMLKASFSSWEPVRRRFNINKDPLEWTEDHVVHWLNWAAKEFSFHSLNAEQFLKMTGRDIVALGREKFIETAPIFTGDILWEHLDILQKNCAADRDLATPLPFTEHKEFEQCQQEQQQHQHQYLVEQQHQHQNLVEQQQQHQHLQQQHQQQQMQYELEQHQQQYQQQQQHPHEHQQQQYQQHYQHQQQQHYQYQQQQHHQQQYQQRQQLLQHQYLQQQLQQPQKQQFLLQLQQKLLQYQYLQQRLQPQQQQFLLRPQRMKHLPKQAEASIHPQVAASQSSHSQGLYPPRKSQTEPAFEIIIPPDQWIKYNLAAYMKLVPLVKGPCGGTFPETHDKVPSFTDCRNIQLWQFLLDLLRDPSCNNIISWTGDGWEFKITEPEEVARRWGIRKNKPKMTYHNLTRGLRNYYEKNIIQKTAEKYYVYRFLGAEDGHFPPVTVQVSEKLGDGNLP